MTLLLGLRAFCPALLSNPPQSYPGFIPPTEVGGSPGPAPSREAPFVPPLCGGRRNFENAITNLSNGSIQKQKLRSFIPKVKSGEMTMEAVKAFLQSQTSYYDYFDDHGRVLKLKRMYHAMYEEDNLCAIS